MNISEIDFSDLMDLRVDYAFKLFFATGDTSRLVSLLNAIFKNKRIPRVITSLVVVNPNLEKADAEDKLSVLDIRATLTDGTSILIEMHLYDLTAHKFKLLRSWARVYGEELEEGQEYTEQKIVMHISFANGPLQDASGKHIEKIHSLFHIIERDGHEVLTSDLEIHYINMKAFVKRLKELVGQGDLDEAELDDFTVWLALITQKSIGDKEAIRRICEREDMKEAVAALARLSADKIKRHAYQRRMDELRTYNHIMSQIAVMGAAIADKDAAIADKDAEIAGKDAEIASMAAEIAALLAKLNEGQ